MQTSDAGLAGLRPEAGLSFRGGFGTLPRDALRPGARYQHHGALLTTRDVRLATNNFAEPDLVAVFGPGLDTQPISTDRADLEVLYPPEPTFTVTAQQPFDDSLWLTLVVIDDPDHSSTMDVAEGLRRIGRLVTAARTLPPADVADPVRYVGPIGVDADGRVMALD